MSSLGHKQVNVANTYVALLRGVNVGGNNKLPMKDLAALFVAAGCQDVRTFIQSGNVIFNPGRCAAAKICLGVSTAVEKQFGFRPAIVLRSAAQMELIWRNNPFLPSATEERLYVFFLADTPSAAAVQKLDPNRSPPDSFVVQGAEIYLRLDNGAAVTKLTNAYFDAKLATVSTARNWRTVGKLTALMRGELSGL
jgi:uncharacterized protein (DUF1697 family)